MWVHLGHTADVAVWMWVVCRDWGAVDRGCCLSGIQAQRRQQHIPLVSASPLGLQMCENECTRIRSCGAAPHTNSPCLPQHPDRPAVPIPAVLVHWLLVELHWLFVGENTEKGAPAVSAVRPCFGVGVAVVRPAVAAPATCILPSMLLQVEFGIPCEGVHLDVSARRDKIVRCHSTRAVGVVIPASAALCFQ